MTSLAPIIAAAALFISGLSTIALAQPASASTEPTQVVNLSASAAQRVQQDWLRVVVRVRTEGAQAMPVQRQIKRVVDDALTRLRPHNKPLQLEVKTGSFSVQPRYTGKDRVLFWQGEAELVIEGRDFGKIGQLAGELKEMSVESAAFSLSREARQQLEAEVQSQAVQRFRQRAESLARDFGFKDYVLRQATVGSVNHPAPGPMVMMARAASATEASAPLALESGQEDVQVTVSGSVQLR